MILSIFRNPRKSESGGEIERFSELQIIKSCLKT